MFLHTAKLTLNDRKVLTLKSVANPGGIAFDFTFEKRKFDPWASITVILYNINDDTLGELTKKAEGQAFLNVSTIKCEAGYQNDNVLIFSGTVFEVITRYEVGQKVTSVTCSNFTEGLFKKKASLEYRKAPRISQVVRDLATKIGATANTSKLQTSDDVVVSDGAWNTPPVTIPQLLQNIAADNALIVADYRIDTVFISSQRPSLDDEIDFSSFKPINSDNGMILSPSVTSNNLILVKMLFRPDLVVGDRTTIRSNEIFVDPSQADGINIVDSPTGQTQTIVGGEVYKVKHDFRQASSFTEIEVLPGGQEVARNNLSIGKV